MGHGRPWERLGGQWHTWKSAQHTVPARPSRHPPSRGSADTTLQAKRSPQPRGARRLPGSTSTPWSSHSHGRLTVCREASEGNAEERATAACPPAWGPSCGAIYPNMPRSGPRRRQQGAGSAPILRPFAMGRCTESGGGWSHGVELVAEHSGRSAAIHTWPEGGSAPCVWSGGEVPSRQPVK